MAWDGLVATVGFVAAGLAIIPMDIWLDRRRSRRRRYMARRKGRRHAG